MCALLTPLIRPMEKCRTRRKPFFIHEHHMCDEGGRGDVWESSHHTPQSNPLGLYLPPQPIRLTLTLTNLSGLYDLYFTPPPKLDYPQISIVFPIMFFSYLDCLQKLKKSWLDGSLKQIGARTFLFRDLRALLSKHVTFSGEKKKEAIAKATWWRAFHILWIIHKYLSLFFRTSSATDS